MSGVLNLSFFFFQAEDGIRDVAVTGVQTCALPISYGDRYIFAELDQKTLELGIRADWTMNARISFQLYLRSEEHTSELQSRLHLVCRLLLEKKNKAAMLWLRTKPSARSQTNRFRS